MRADLYGCMYLFRNAKDVDGLREKLIFALPASTARSGICMDSACSQFSTEWSQKRKKYPPAPIGTGGACIYIVRARQKQPIGDFCRARTTETNYRQDSTNGTLPQLISNGRLLSDYGKNADFADAEPNILFRLRDNSQNRSSLCAI